MSDDPSTRVPDRVSPKEQAEAEYLLKGVQAFSLSVALCAADLAVIQATFHLSYFASESIYLNAALRTAFALLSLPIA